MSQLTLPEFIEREGIRVKAYEPVAPGDMSVAWKVVLVNRNRKQLTIPCWGHGGGLGSPAEEVPSVISSLVTDASIADGCGGSVAEYESEFGPIDEEDRQENRRRIKEILTSCERERRQLIRFLGEDLYNELVYDVEQY